MIKEKRQRVLKALLIPFLSVISGLVLTGLIIFISGKPPFEALMILYQKGFSCNNISSECDLFTTLELMTPIVLMGLAAVIVFSSGMFFIGQAGQFMIGAAVAAYLGYAIHLPPVIHPIFIMVIAMAVGAFIGWIVGLLRIKLSIHELLLSILMNPLAQNFFDYLVNYPMRSPNSHVAYSTIIDKTAWLPSFTPSTHWGVGWIIAMVLVVVIYIYLKKSTLGYEQRMAGQSNRFALFGGIPSDKAAIRAMLIGGALSSLAGVVVVLGSYHRIMAGFGAGTQFDGLMASLLGQTHPLGVVIVAFLFAGLQTGANLGLQINLDIPREVGGFVMGAMILFVAMPDIFNSWIDSARKLSNRIFHHKNKKE